MLKKFKDLTEEELESICKKHNYCCYGCPLKRDTSPLCLGDLQKYIDLLSQELDKKVEVFKNE